jgi:hypothetical protein
MKESKTLTKHFADFCTVFLVCLVSLVPFNQTHRLNLGIDTIQGSKRQVLFVTQFLCCSRDESVEVKVELPCAESPAPDEPDTDR